MSERTTAFAAVGPWPPKWALRALSLVTAALVWEAIARTMDSLLLPSFTATMGAAGRLATQRDFWSALATSNVALASGFAAAAILAIPAGIAMGHWPWFGRASRYYLDLLLVVPMAALAPLLIMATGVGLLTRGLIVFLFAFPVIAANARAGRLEIDARLVDMAGSFGAGPTQIWRRVLAPAALPSVMTGVRLGLGRAMAGLVVAEVIVIASGLGGLLLERQGDLDSASAFAVAAVVVVESLVLIQLAGRVERRVSAWRTREAFE